MTVINTTLIKELRKKTGMGIQMCKSALIEANGNIELAIDIMRKFGLAISSTKSNRQMLSGVILTTVASNKRYGVMVEINCETDFVAKDNIFQVFANSVMTTALNEEISDINVLKLKFTVQCSDLIAKVSENINISRLVTLTGGIIGCYVHNTKIGVLVSASNNATTELIKNLAMHIAASNPRYINIQDIPEEIIERERRIQIDIAMNSKKSHEIIERIVVGKMNKFFSEITLIQQSFIMDTNKTVGEILKNHNVKINNFVRFEIGDNI